MNESLERENEALRRALRFYADSNRYHGPNRRLEVMDEYQPANLVYLLDVTRDGGSIARKALAGES